MGGAVPAGGRRWAWCDVEVPWGHVHSGDKRAQDCHVPVLHSPRKAAVPLEGSGCTRMRELMVCDLGDRVILEPSEGGLFTGDVSTSETPSQSAFEDGCE